MDSWRGLFADPIKTGDIWRAVGVMLIYSAVFCAAGLVVFRRKDVLS